MFTIKTDIPDYPFKIDYKDQLMFLGSCFSENIGSRFTNAFFSTEVNPFGVLFNPVSVSNGLHRMLSGRLFVDDELFRYGSLWNSFSHSSLFSGTDKIEALDYMNRRLMDASRFLLSGKFLFITFGTAWVFRLKADGRVVSNCHKLPADNFIRTRLDSKQIVADFSELIGKINEVNPSLNIIFTVSPVRHLKDGLIENNISKSTLILSVHELVEQFRNVFYFPAYEMVIDELRDYRYYAADMMHPSDVAVDYIWQQLGKTFFNQDTMALKQRLEQLFADMQHRPLHPSSEEFRKFVDSVEKKKESLMEEFPFLNGRL